MELISWGIVALGGFLIVFMVRKNLEEKRIEKAKADAINKVMLAELQIFKERYGYYPTKRDMLQWYDEIRGL